MPIVSPDDAARDLPWLYPGPKNVRIPAAPIAAHGMFLSLWIGASLVAGVCVANPTQWLIASIVLIPVALLLTKLIFKKVDTVRTLRFFRDGLRSETSTPRPPIDPGPDTAEVEHRLSPAIFARRDQL